MQANGDSYVGIKHHSRQAEHLGRFDLTICFDGVSQQQYGQPRGFRQTLGGAGRVCSSTHKEAHNSATKML